MKKTILIIFFFICINYAKAQHEEYLVCGAGNYSTFSLEIVSGEDTIMNGVSIFRVKLKAIDSTKIDTLYFIDSLGFNCSIDSQFVGTWLLPGDSIYATVRIAYDVDSLPYYPKMLSLVCEGVDSGNIPTRKEVSVVLYFTPWNSLEIWDKYDYDELPRRWDQPNTGEAEPARVYINKNTLPISTALSIDSLENDYDYEMQYVQYVEHLPYGILMRATNADSVKAWEIRDSLFYVNNLPHLRSSWNSHFFGTVKGRITFSKRDDHDNPVICPLSGVRVNLVYYSAGKKLAKSFITDKEGNYSLHFDFKSYSRAPSGTVELGLELISQNPIFDISVSRRKTNRKKYYVISENVSIFDNANNGSDITHDFNLLDPDAPAFQALHYASNAYTFLKTQNNVMDMNNGLGIYIYGKDKGSSHYFPLVKTIFLELEDTKRESVVYHEFGHHTMHILQGGSIF
ncbi:MAG: hypothetical protein HYZ42_02105 [Bacteroidetes bacterium]|nr:hypothetical protein [Bacteroidota bacterium]